MAIPHFFADTLARVSAGRRPVWGLRGISLRPEGNLGDWPTLEILAGVPSVVLGFFALQAPDDRPVGVVAAIMEPEQLLVSGSLTVISVGLCVLVEAAVVVGQSVVSRMAHHHSQGFGWPMARPATCQGN